MRKRSHFSRNWRPWRSRFQDLLEKQTRLRERKTALELSRADARKSAVSFHRDFNTPSTSTPRVSLHRAQASRTRSAQINFTPAPAHPRRKAQARTAAMTQPPPLVFEIPTRNSFAALCETECNAVVIGDSIVRNVRSSSTKGKVQTHCFPGARVLDVSAQVPAIQKDDANVGAVVLHMGVNDVRMRQSEILKRDFRSLIEMVRNALPTARIIVSGPLPTYRRGNEKFSRLFALNKWLMSWCIEQKLLFVDNFDLFWERPRLFHPDGLHPSSTGAVLLSDNQSSQHDLNHLKQDYSLLVARNLRTRRTQRALDEVDINLYLYNQNCKCVKLFASDDKCPPYARTTCSSDTATCALPVRHRDVGLQKYTFEEQKEENLLMGVWFTVYCLFTRLDSCSSPLQLLPLGQIMKRYQIAYHSYADDTQIYLALSPNDYRPIDSLCQCIDEINSWMCQNFLQLNKNKTEVIVFGNKDETNKVNTYLDLRGLKTQNRVKNLVILESDLNFRHHVKAISKSAYHHLRNSQNQMFCLKPRFRETSPCFHYQQGGLL
ncbi:uncharacterized protein LOC130552200 isoform X2 [Triplophysa rosa]|nr:uncharacterized protein LOC130552200 isoform X2 [Triplophysa rosa]XP_057186375.1 uncharacterized protein LOC130552200 isoform X2 [Triplophysa rosa]XP_057186376.1 uncharacterized protein LOC130552200 isoform X2 [Triplophysa rosa]XP_057186377.1 uncharacterized protein LOC130552200 isoform X2 [Triplophysa rosa]